MPEKKRVTTAPLTQGEIAEALSEIPEEEFLSKFDDIFSRELDLPGKLEGLITLDDYMDNELREMFQSIIAQYIQPIEATVDRIRVGDYAKRTAQEGLDALAPILSAAESLEYNDIAANLKRIEQPLDELASGAKRKLTKREVVELGAAWDVLSARLRPEGDREQSTTAPLSLSGLTRLDGISQAHVRTLRGAGLLNLNDIASAPTTDLVAVTGLPDVVAERVRAFAVGAATVAGTSTRRAPTALAAGWTRVHVESDAFKGTFTFESSRLGKYFEPVLALLSMSEAAVTQPATVAPARKRAARPATKKRTK